MRALALYDLSMTIVLGYFPHSFLFSFLFFIFVLFFLCYDLMIFVYTCFLVDLAIPFLL